MSKVKTLHKAIEYISQLQDLLIHSDTTQALVGHPNVVSNHQAKYWSGENFFLFFFKEIRGVASNSAQIDNANKLCYILQD